MPTSPPEVEEPTTDEDEQLAALQKRLIRQRARSAAEAAGVEPSPGDGLSRLDASEGVIAISLSARRRISQAAVVGQAFAQGVVGGMQLVRERCHARGIPPYGDVADALLGWDACSQWERMVGGLREGKRFVMLLGTTGTGKSALAARVILRAGAGSLPEHIPLFSPWQSLIEGIRHPYDDERKATKKRCSQTPALAMDDLCRGTEALKKEDIEALNELWAARTEAGLVTIVTANMELDEFGQKFMGNRLSDRLRSRGMHIQLKGASRRTRQKGDGR